MKNRIFVIIMSVVMVLLTITPISVSASETTEYNLSTISGKYSSYEALGDSTGTDASTVFDAGEFPLTYVCEVDYGTSNTSSLLNAGSMVLYPLLKSQDYIELTYYYSNFTTTLVSSYNLSRSFYIYGKDCQASVSLSNTGNLTSKNGYSASMSWLSKEPIFDDDFNCESILSGGKVVGFKITGTLISDVTYISIGHSAEYTKGAGKKNGTITIKHSSVDDLSITVKSAESEPDPEPEHNTDTCYLTDNNCDNICDVCFRTIIDATENNRIMPTNRYLIEENPAMPDYTFYQTYHNTSTLDGLDAMCLFLVDIDTGLETRIAVPVKGVLVTPQEIKYYVDDQWLTVYKGAPLADAGWINDSYRMITFLDAKVTNDFKQFFFNQSLKKPNYNNYYEFCDKGIAYNGEFVARYENDDTPRVDWSNNYVVIYEYNEKLYIAQSFDYMQFGKVDGFDAIRLYDYSTYDYWVVDDETIKYMGVAQSFTPDALLAGNESIINWSDETTYFYFDTGIQAYLGDESIFDENEEIDPDATWLERILYKVVEIREKINSIPKMIVEGIKNTLEQLFVPDQEYITHKVHYMFEQFSFLTVINDSMNYIKEYLLNEEFNEPPVIEINLGLAESDYYWGGNVVALDMTWYARYKPTIDAFLSAWIWLVFIYQLFTRLPNIVSGVAGDFKTIMTPAGKISKNNKNNGKEGKK